MSQSEISSEPPQSRSEIELLRGANQRISSHLGWLVGVMKAKAATAAAGPATVSREEVAALFEETAGKILSIGHLHHCLAEDPSHRDVELSDYVVNMCSAFISALALESRISVVNRMTPNCRVSSEQAQIVCLMVSEILMNAVQYAHPTGIPARFTIECRNQGNDRLMLSLRDDGVGLPEGMDANSEGGTGVKLIRSLAIALNADLRIESDDLGLGFVMDIRSQAQPAGELSVSAANVRNFPKLNVVGRRRKK